MSDLATWQEQLRSLDPVVDTLLEIWRPDGPTEAEVQDMTKLALSILACGYLCQVYTDADRPVFMPLWNYACNQGGPNPDYVYLNAQVDEGGVYEITGFRGTTRFVEITQQQHNGLSMNVFNRPAGDGAPRKGPTTHDLDELTIGDDGSFRVILSAERPEGHTGDWWQMDPGVQGLLMRLCACDWINEVDARVAINRLDKRGEDMTPADFSRRFARMPEWIEGMIHFDMHLVRYYLEHHGTNVLLQSQWIQQGGGLATKQAYYDGIHQIDDDEALVVEFPVPSECHYWQILVADDRFATVDWVNRLSSINDAQAHLDDEAGSARSCRSAIPGSTTGSTRPTSRGACCRRASTAPTSTPRRTSPRCQSIASSSTCRAAPAPSRPRSAWSSCGCGGPGRSSGASGERPCRAGNLGKRQGMGPRGRLRVVASVP
jgi:hypothetical protein